MKLKFKTQAYQSAAVQAVVDCFKGQPPALAEVITYRIDPGQTKKSTEDRFIAFKEGSVKHVYFVAETKGTMSSMELREIEKTKIKCAHKFFDEINLRFAPEAVNYDVVDSFGKLMELVK